MTTREDADRRFAQIEGERDYHRKRAERLESERDALSAQLARLHGAVFRPFVQCCTDEESLREARRIAAEEFGVSRDMLKAKWQSEALDRLKQLLEETHMDKAPTVTRAAVHVDDAINRVKQECRPLELRGQAEEPAE